MKRGKLNLTEKHTQVNTLIPKCKVYLFYKSYRICLGYKVYQNIYHIFYKTSELGLVEIYKIN